MNRTHPVRRALAGACALTLLFAACGDDDDSGDDESTEESTTTAADDGSESTEAPDESTESEPEEETTTSEGEGEEGGEGDPEAVASAEAINLKIEDFAEGWVEEAPSDDSGSGSSFDDCFTTTDVEGTTLGESESPTFSIETETEGGQGGQVVSMQTIVFDSPESASAVLAEIATPEFAMCTQQGITEDSTEGAEAALTPLVDDPPVGEESVGLAGAVQVPVGDAPQQGQVDLHGIRTGSIASFTFTVDIGATPDGSFESTLTELYTVIADRQAAEAG